MFPARNFQRNQLFPIRIFMSIQYMNIKNIINMYLSSIYLIAHQRCAAGSLRDEVATAHTLRPFGA